MGRDELVFETPGLEPEPMEQSEWGGDWGKSTGGLQGDISNFTLRLIRGRFYCLKKGPNSEGPGDGEYFSNPGVTKLGRTDGRTDGNASMKNEG